MQGSYQSEFYTPVTLPTVETSALHCDFTTHRATAALTRVCGSLPVVLYLLYSRHVGRQARGTDGYADVATHTLRRSVFNV